MKSPSDAVKRCFRCGETRHLDEFYRHAGMADGHLGKCKSCTRIDVQENYRANREQYRAYERERAQKPERKAQARASNTRVRLRAPEKYRARAAVRTAVRNGQLRRGKCENCGSLRVQAHHEDYSRPLDVRWLCFACHRAEHGQVAVDSPGVRAGKVEDGQC